MGRDLVVCGWKLEEKLWSCFALAVYFRQAVTTTARFRSCGSAGDFGVSHIKVDGQIEIAFVVLHGGFCQTGSCISCTLKI